MKEHIGIYICAEEDRQYYEYPEPFDMLMGMQFSLSAGWIDGYLWNFYMVRA